MKVSGFCEASMVWVTDLLCLISALASQLLALQCCLGERVCHPKGSKYTCIVCVAGEEAGAEHKSQGNEQPDAIASDFRCVCFVIDITPTRPL